MAVIEKVKIIVRKAIAFFSNKEMYQLILKFSDGEVTELEQKKIDKWVNAYEDRKLNFEDLKKAIQFQKQLASSEEKDAKAILKDLKVAFPDKFAGISNQTPVFILMRVLKGSIIQQVLDLCYAVVYDYRWIRLLGRLVFIILIVLIVLKVLNIN